MYKIQDKKLKIIHNGVDADFWNPQKINQSEIEKLKDKYWLKNKIILLYYGHTWKSKGIDYLVKAIPQIIKIDPKIKLVFNLIDCKRKNKIQQQIQQYQKTNKEKIVLIDWLEMYDLRNLVSSADIIIAPSISEWFGSVHTESVSMWKTLLTTNISSIPEVVRGKVKFINPCSSKEILRWIQEILEWNIDTIAPKKFSWDFNVTQLETLYKKTTK
jgi:glycosyltransferase involved in cell wall biosynthesis